MPSDTSIYPGGFRDIMRKWERARGPWKGAEEVLPPSDVDLRALRDTVAVAPTRRPEPRITKQFADKTGLFQTEFDGQSALFVLHAQLVSLLRRDTRPQRSADMFFRLWSEQGAFLAENLATRWQISAATTFAEHGRTAVQTSLGMGLSVLFDMILLHDTERRLTGQPGAQPFRRNGKVAKPDLAFDMTPYRFRGGDADRNILARLWALAEQDPVMAPLAMSMLKKAATDRRSIFGRLDVLRARRAEADARRAARRAGESG